MSSSVRPQAANPTLDLNEAIKANSIEQVKSTLSVPEHAAFVNEWLTRSDGDREWLANRITFCIRQGMKSKDVLSYLLEIWREPAVSFVGGLLGDAYEEGDTETLRIVYSFYLKHSHPSPQEIRNQLTELSNRFTEKESNQVWVLETLKKLR